MNSQFEWMRQFAHEYGWRAYAIPVLAVLTVWVLIDMSMPALTEHTGHMAQGGHASQVAASQAQGENRGASPDPARVDAAAVPITEIPPGGPFTQTGARTFHVAGTPGAAAGQGAQDTYRYVVEVEDGVDTSAYGGDEAVARLVDATLTDPRSWNHDPAFRFEHVAADQQPNLRIRLSSLDTTHALCGGGDLDMETSCRTTLTGENLVVLNEARWVRGAVPFAGDIGSYRQYVINHEVGHAIGYAAHMPCGGDGQLAPIMMQQTLSLSNSQLHALAPAEVYRDDNATCRYNAWPYPVADAG